VRGPFSSIIHGLILLGSAAVLGIIKGILPPVLLAVLFMLLPVVIRLMIKFQGVVRKRYVPFVILSLTRADELMFSATLSSSSSPAFGFFKSSMVSSSSLSLVD